MKEYLRKLRSILHSPGLAAVLHWSQCIHGRELLICAVTLLSTLLSVVFPVITKNLVDGAVSSDLGAIRKAAVLLGILLILLRIMSVLSSHLRYHAAFMFQKSTLKRASTFIDWRTVFGMSCNFRSRNTW